MHKTRRCKCSLYFISFVLFCPFPTGIYFQLSSFILFLYTAYFIYLPTSYRHFGNRKVYKFILIIIHVVILLCNSILYATVSSAIAHQLLTHSSLLLADNHVFALQFHTFLPNHTSGTHMAVPLGGLHRQWYQQL